MICFRKPRSRLMYYFDSAYVVKCYLNDPDSEPVRDLVRTPVSLYSSALCIPALHSRGNLCHPSPLPREAINTQTGAWKQLRLFAPTLRRESGS